MTETRYTPGNPPDDSGGYQQDASPRDSIIADGLVDDDGFIAGPLPCPDCDYDLMKQPLAGNCPECGQAIAIMLQRNPLSLAPAKWIRRLKWGALLMPVSFLAMVVVSVMSALFYMYFFADWVEFVRELPAILLACSVWLLCAKEPGTGTDPSEERVAQIGRFAAMVAVALILVGYGSIYLSDYLFMCSFELYFILESIAHTLVILTGGIGIVASVYRIDSLHARQRPNTTRFRGRALKQLLTMWIVFLPVTSILASIDMWFLFFGEISDLRGFIYSLITAIYHLLVGVATVVVLIWLHILVIGRYFSFRHAHRMARLRDQSSNAG